MTVLIIDDDALILEVMEKQLNVIGIDDVMVCNSGGLAIDKVNADIDLILCDLQMPDMDGVEFVRHLGESGYVGSLVLISGECLRTIQAAEKLAQAYELNILGYIQKPVELAALKVIFDKAEAPEHKFNNEEKKQYFIDDLQKAIVNKDIFNVYQPKVSIKTGELIGFESLVRWQHPSDGILFPDQFISLAEETGLIDDLTYAVLEEAALDSRKLLDFGLKPHLSVNISMNNLTTVDFPEKVVSIFSGHAIEHSQLCLELTESRFLFDTKLPLDILTRFRLKGVELSIDDFGTGHSSLVQLRNLPFDELKLDKSFVQGISQNDDQQVIIKSNIDMAKELGLRTVAEGVEDLSDWNFLRKTNLDLVQGYFVSRPIRVSELSQWAEEWKLRLPELLSDIGS